MHFLLQHLLQLVICRSIRLNFLKGKRSEQMFYVYTFSNSSRDNKSKQLHILFIRSSVWFFFPLSDSGRIALRPIRCYLHNACELNNKADCCVCCFFSLSKRLGINAILYKKSIQSVLNFCLHFFITRLFIVNSLSLNFVTIYNAIITSVLINSTSFKI